MTAASAGPHHELLGDYFARHPDQAAQALEALPARDVVRLLEKHPEHRPALLGRLRLELAAEALQSAEPDVFRAMVQELDLNRAAALLARSEPKRRKRRLALLPPALAKELEELMTYPPDSAGGLMDPAVTTFHPENTVREVITALRAARHKRIFHVFVIDGEANLVGSVAVQDLAIAGRNDRLETVMQRAPAFVRAVASRTEVVELYEQRRTPAIAVVDVHHRLLGVIRYDALLAATEQEASADIQTMVGVSRDERALSTVWFAVRRRLPWLQVNLGTAFLASFVVGLFENTIARFTALAVLLPVVAGQSGNTGAQALAVTMRGLALREIRVRHALRIAWKEVAVGAANGVAVAVVTAGAVFLWSQSAGLAVVIGIAMVTSMTLAGLSGALIPMLLTVLRQDPAQASSIILTTVTDVVGFLSFLGLATLAAGML